MGSNGPKGGGRRDIDGDVGCTIGAELFQAVMTEHERRNTVRCPKGPPIMLNRTMANKTSTLVVVLAFSGLLSAFDSPAHAQELATVALDAAKARGGGGDALAEQEGKLEATHVARLGLKIASGQCVVAAAASHAATDLELSVRTPGGLSLSDGEPGPVAHLRYCAGKGAENAQVRVRSDKATSYTLGVWAVHSGTEGRQPSSTRAPASAATPAVTLAQRLALAANIHAKGLAAMTVPHEEDLGSGDERARDLPLDGGRCYRVVAVAEPGLMGVDLALQDSSGASLLAGGGKPVIVMGNDAAFCPADAASFKLVVSTSAGAGRVVWQVFGAPHPKSQGRWQPGGEGDSWVAKRLRASHQQLGEGKPAAMPFEAGKLTTAQAAQASFEVQPGSCYIAIAAGAPSLRSIDLAIIDQRGNVVAQALDQGSVARARVCADLRSRWTARVRVFKGYGDYALQVFGGP